MRKSVKKMTVSEFEKSVPKKRTHATTFVAHGFGDEPPEGWGKDKFGRATIRFPADGDKKP